MQFHAEIADVDAALFDSLARQLKVRNNAELLSGLLSVASWIIAERRQGRRLASVGPEGVSQELNLPLFEQIAPASLPSVAVEWKPEELARLADLLALDEPPQPNEKLCALLRGSS